MCAAPDPVGLSDEALCARSAQGDWDAFAALYERYFSPVYDFALRTLRDESAAGDVVQAAFERAYLALRKGFLPERFRGWLFTIASRLCIDEYRQRARYAEVDLMEGDEMLPMPVSPLGDPESEYQRAESIRLVEQAARGLRPADYILFDLYFRQGVEADELAKSLETNKGALYTRLSRLKTAFEQSVICLLLIRQGRGGCPQLAQLLEELQPAELTQPIRITLWEHIQDCGKCTENRKRWVSPVELFAALPLSPAQVGVKDAIWHRIDPARSASTLTRTRKAPLKAIGLVAAGSAFTLFAAMLIWLWLIILAPRDPQKVHSLSHDIGVPSNNPIIAVEWSPSPGSLAYAVSWSQSTTGLPDTSGGLLPGSQTSVASPVLADGEWYFNLRTKGLNGRWTGTVHLGPFILISGAEKGVSPRPTPTPAGAGGRSPVATPVQSLSPTITSRATKTNLLSATPIPAFSAEPGRSNQPSPTSTPAAPQPILTQPQPIHTPLPPATQTQPPLPSPTDEILPSETPTTVDHEKPTDTPSR